jgi:hypothetical protein
LVSHHFIGKSLSYSKTGGLIRGLTSAVEIVHPPLSSLLLHLLLRPFRSFRPPPHWPLPLQRRPDTHHRRVNLKIPRSKGPSHPNLIPNKSIATSALLWARNSPQTVVFEIFLPFWTIKVTSSSQKPPSLFVFSNLDCGSSRFQAIYVHLQGNPWRFFFSGIVTALFGIFIAFSNCSPLQLLPLHHKSASDPIFGPDSTFW